MGSIVLKNELQNMSYKTLNFRKYINSKIEGFLVFNEHIFRGASYTANTKLYNVGQMSSTLIQHCINVIQMVCLLGILGLKLKALSYGIKIFTHLKLCHTTATHKLLTYAQFKSNNLSF